MKTYWLWFGKRVLTTVRAPEGTSDDQARYLALRWHERVPLCYPEPPYAFGRLLMLAQVRTYPGER